MFDTETSDAKRWIRVGPGRQNSTDFDFMLMAYGQRLRRPLLFLCAGLFVAASAACVYLNDQLVRADFQYRAAWQNRYEAGHAVKKMKDLGSLMRLSDVSLQAMLEKARHDPWSAYNIEIALNDRKKNALPGGWTKELLHGFWTLEQKKAVQALSRFGVPYLQTRLKTARRKNPWSPGEIRDALYFQKRLRSDPAAFDVAKTQEALAAADHRYWMVRRSLTASSVIAIVAGIGGFLLYGWRRFLGLGLGMAMMARAAVTIPLALLLLPYRRFTGVRGIRGLKTALTAIDHAWLEAKSARMSKSFSEVPLGAFLSFWAVAAAVLAAASWRMAFELALRGGSMKFIAFLLIVLGMALLLAALLMLLAVGFMLLDRISCSPMLQQRRHSVETRASALWFAVALSLIAAGLWIPRYGRFIIEKRAYDNKVRELPMMNQFFENELHSREIALSAINRSGSRSSIEKGIDSIREQRAKFQARFVKQIRDHEDNLNDSRTTALAFSCLLVGALCSVLGFSACLYSHLKRDSVLAVLRSSWVAISASVAALASIVLTFRTPAPYDVGYVPLFALSALILANAVFLYGKTS